MATAAVVAGAAAPTVTWSQQAYDLPARPSNFVSVPEEEWDNLQQRLRDNEIRLQQLESLRLPPIDGGYPTGFSASRNANAGTESVDDRLKSIESDLKKAAEKEQKKRSEDALKPTFRMNGRLHVDYWAFPETSPGANAFETGSPDNSIDDRFLFRRARIEMRGTIPDNMIYKLDLEFGTPNNPQFKDAFIGWTELPVLGELLLGNQKRPYGLDHLNSSKNNVFLERPYIIEAFNQDARRFGLQAYGVSDNLAYNWRYGAFMGQDLQNLGIVTATPVDEDYQVEVAGRFANTIWYDEASDGRGYAHWAVSGSIASPDGDDPANSTGRFQTRPEARTTNRWLDTGAIPGARTYALGGLEGVLNFGPLQVVGEYQSVCVQRDTGGDPRFDGYYVYVSYFLTGEHTPWERERGTLGRVKPFENFFLVRTCDDCIDGGWGAWQVACRYSHADLSDEGVAGGVGDSVTLGLNWWWNAYSRMQFNYIYGNIEDRNPVAGFTSGDYHVIGTRFMVEW